MPVNSLGYLGHSAGDEAMKWENSVQSVTMKYFTNIISAWRRRNAFEFGLDA
jgi:hypothetical protein